MEIMGLEHSPWDYVRSKYGVGLGRWWSEMMELQSTVPMVVEKDLRGLVWRKSGKSRAGGGGSGRRIWCPDD
jgi:hypothetical protein